MAFLLVAALTMLSVAITASSLPRIPAAPGVAVSARLAVLRHPALLTCVAGTIIGAAGGLMPYIFIAPIVADVSDATRNLVPVAIGLNGLAGAAGTMIGGSLNDRWGTDRSIVGLLATTLGATIAMAMVGLIFGGAAPSWRLAVLIVVWGVAGWAYNPMNTRALQLAGPSGTEAIALNTSGLYIGIALAGAIGGGALDIAGGVAVLAAAAGVGAIALLFMTIAVRRYPSAPAGSTGATRRSRLRRPRRGPR